ncbi:MAG TPA: hypothetical protein PL017_12330 [Tenuifilaceae bacterium]|nr:hypothetical protein [Tenuifilaceae bacterium]
MISRLKKSIELKFGKKVLYQKDCKELSISVLRETGEQISSSTLRRFFGFLSTNSQPARVTLDILSAYCGFNSWENYRQANQESECNHLSSIDFWQSAKEKAKNHSVNYCEQVKRATPIGYNCTATRNFSTDRFNFFLNSDFFAMPVIAPGGFGKSTLLVNWYESILKSQNHSNDIFLIIPAITIEVGMGRGRSFEDLLNSFLNPESPAFPFDSNSQQVPGKFLLIIDALDEVTLLGYKTERLFSSLYNFIAKHSSKGWLKLVIASRFPAWESFFTLNAIPNKWCFAQKSLFSSEGANIPPLNEEEIQQVLDNTINNLLEERLLVEEFSYDLIQIVSYPYFLQIFIEIFNPNLPEKVTGRLDLLNHFIKNKVIQGSCSDEKLDIIRKIVEISVNNNTLAGIKKNDLKECYPIHLKLSGNYYTAYNELLSFGVIHEETVEKFPGVFTKFVTLPQGQLFDLFIVQKYVINAGAITFELFERIQNDFDSSPLLPSLIATLFEMAYKQQNVSALKPFFTLKDSTIIKTLQLHAIIYCLRNDEVMRRELIPYWVSNSLARKYYFEQVVDLNAIVKSHKFVVQTYMNQYNSERSIFFSSTLLTLSNVLSLNLVDVFKNEGNLNMIIPKSVSCQIVGLWFSCRLFIRYLGNSNDCETILNEAASYSLARLDTWNPEERVDFELALVLGLVFIKKYDVIEKRLAFLHRWESESTLLPTEKALVVFYEYAIWKRNNTFNTKKMEAISSFLNELPLWNGFYTLILAKAWFAMYLLYQGKLDRALEYYRKAVEVSSISGYLIFEVKLLKNMIPVLEQLGESERAADCKLLANSMLNKTGVEFSLL